MKIINVLPLIFTLGLISKSFANSDIALCDMPEIALGTGHLYNQHVCDVGVYQEKGQLEDAINSAENALELRLFEHPNVYLLPRLALLYVQTGKTEKAREALLMSKVALEALYGISTCMMDYEYEPNLDLGKLYDQGKIGLYKGSIRVENLAAKDIYFEICQEDSYYHTAQFHDLDLLMSSELFQLYQEAVEKYQRAFNTLSE